MTTHRIAHAFVEYIPRELEEGVVYVSIPYATAVHRCLCGCGREVVTPISPTDWQVTFDGKTISLHPSIGSWNLPCKSHYWIRNNGVVWAPQWSQVQIDAARASDRTAKEQYFEARAGAETHQTPTSKTSTAFWKTIRRVLFGR